jgi:hypothetical protein
MYMLYPYRVLKHNLVNGTIELSYHTILRDAYRACLPDNKTHRCHLMLNGLEQKLKNGEDLIRVTCYPKVNYWIESLIGKAEPVPIPELASKIECCHPIE